MRFRISLLGAVDLASHSRASSMLSSAELSMVLWDHLRDHSKPCDFIRSSLDASKLRHAHIYIHIQSYPYDSEFNSHPNESNAHEIILGVKSHSLFKRASNVTNIPGLCHGPFLNGLVRRWHHSGGFHSHGGTPKKKIVYNGKKHFKVDDLGVPSGKLT